MLKMGYKSVFSIIAFFTLYTCIDPFNKNIIGYDSILVVDGLITDSNSSFSVRLSRTVQKQDSNPVMESNAIVSISDNTGKTSYLMNMGNGLFKTDSLDFRGTAGRTYILHISTGDREEYESEPCQMEEIQDIDTIYFEKDNELVSNGTGSLQGIKIFIGSKGGDAGAYYRWDFVETWKFRVPDPKRYDYLDETVIIPHLPVNKFCWKSHISDEILIQSAYSGSSENLWKIPLVFIPSDKSDRLLIKYSILARQYSISKKEYEFWNNIRQVSESGDDIFGSQPYTVIGNVHNIKNPDEMVLGYFQVSAVREKRKYITISEIAILDLPLYQNSECERIAKSPGDYPYRITWNEIYEMYCITSDYLFVEPLYDPTYSNLEKLIFTRPECADCGLSGTPSKPAFWIN